MTSLEKVVYVFRHKDTKEIVSVFGDEYSKYKENPQYEHVGSLNPLAWIKHHWDIVEDASKYSNGSIYIYKIPNDRGVAAITDEQNWEYENDDEWELVEHIDDYIDWIERNYKL